MISCAPVMSADLLRSKSFDRDSFEKLWRGRRFLIGGDWNSSRLFDNFREYDPPVATAFFIRARQRGWYESHGGKPEKRSYLKPTSHPYQLDHLFCNRSLWLQMTDCSVRNEPRVTELSDHAPLVAEFNL
jgi:endonuclease/exonuclease/phosphatase family metal-dependent hydrolase